MYGVLIADDEPQICEGLKRIIDWASYGFSDIRTAFDGESALASVRSQPPDLLITDIRMPKISGVELLKRIRELGLDVPTVVLSGYDDFEYIRSMAVLGIENYLLKPVIVSEIRLTVINVVKKLEKRALRQRQSKHDIGVIRDNIINRWVNGTIDENELEERADFLGLNLNAEYYQPCILKIFGDGPEKNVGTKNEVHTACESILSGEHNIYSAQNYEGDTVGIFWGDRLPEEQDSIASSLFRCMDAAKLNFQEHLYVFLGKTVRDYWKVSESLHDSVRRSAYMVKTSASPGGCRPAEQGNALSPFSIRLADYVIKNYGGDLSLKLLAAHFNGNAAYIGQVFKRDFGESFSEFLTSVRIEKAQELLRNSSCSAKEISSKVGFQNEAYFSSVFKRSTGLSPLEYKKMLAGGSVSS